MARISVTLLMAKKIEGMMQFIGFKSCGPSHK
jgi:hypothetical protein